MIMPAHKIENKPTPNPSGLCMCGCGGITSIAEETNLPIQRVKGEHIRFIRGHHRRGIPHPLKDTGDSTPRHLRRDVKQMAQWRKEYERRNPEKVRENRCNQNSRRRTMYRETDITAEWLLELRRNTSNCLLCEKDFDKKYGEPRYPSLDHILPLFLGGTHTKDNVRYICITCNKKRPRNVGN